MAYAPILVANELLELHGDGGIDPLKLQKLMYFTEGWWLAMNGEPLLSERPQVWRYGPVFQSLYSVFNKYGRKTIVGPEASSPFGGGVPRLGKDDALHVKGVLDWIWEQYGAKSGTALSDETHKIGTPWRNIAERNNFRIPFNEEIPLDEDWAYFAGLARARGLTPTPLHHA